MVHGIQLIDIQEAHSGLTKRSKNASYANLWVNFKLFLRFFTIPARYCLIGSGFYVKNRH